MNTETTIQSQAIAADIQAIRDIPTGLVLKGSSDIAAAIDALRLLEVTEARFAEFMEAATAAIEEADYTLVQMHGSTKGAELAAAEADAARVAELARLAAERAELAEQRVAADRVAAEQAAQAEQLRIERERANAELKAAQDKLNADVAEHAAKLAADREAAESAAADAEAERARPQELFEQAAVDAHAPCATLPEILADGADLDDIMPTDDEIIEVLMETFGMGRAETLDRLAAIDLSAAREAA